MIKKKSFKNLLFFISIILLVMVPLVSAGIVGDFFRGITGFQTATFGVSLGVQNFRPNITFISNGTLTLSAGDTTTFDVSFIAEDTNTKGDLNTSSIIMNATFSNPSASTEFARNFTCSVAAGQLNLNANQRNYSCGANNFTFFDGAGSWNISISIADNSSNFTENLTQSFTIAQLVSINLSLTTLNFPAVTAGDDNVTSSNDPQTIQNLGNKDSIAINLTGYDLIGDDNGDTTKRLEVLNFTVNYITDAAEVECNYNGTAGSGAGARLLNATGVPANVTIVKGADRTNDTYFCLLHVRGDIQAQTYSTGGTPDEDDWIFTAG